ncbi:unnamed protein product [Clavelina lepadiformis]|uniref:Lipid-binding serum glycoprotein N-terminal domain-containing protein n=1 Tax=Clavelina lepadiformis TaxID=159417 RepID=A0ABP0G8A2_CLALP
MSTIARFCFINFYFAIVASQRASVQISVKQSGLDQVKDDVLSFISSKLASVLLPTFYGENFQVSNVKIDVFEAGSGESMTSPPNGYKIISQGGAVVVKGEWKVWQMAHFFTSSITLSYEGALSARIPGAAFTQDFVLRSNGGKPEFAVGSCEVDLGKVQVQVHDTSRPWVIETVVNATEQPIRDALLRLMCPVITEVLRDESSALTRRFDANFPLFLQTGVKLDLLRSPAARLDSVDIYVRGRSFPLSNPQLSFPFPSPLLPSPLTSSHMSRFTLSTYVINTLLYSLHVDEYFRESFTSGQIREFSQTLPRAPLGIFASRSVGIIFESDHSPDARLKPPYIEISGNFTLTVRRTLASRSRTISRSRAEATILLSISANSSAVQVITERTELSLGNPLIRAMASDSLTKAIGPAVQSALNHAIFSFPQHFGYSPYFISTEVAENFIRVDADFR